MLDNLQKEKSIAFFEVFKICALCDNRFNYNPEQLTYWANRVANKYPKLTEKEFEVIVQGGTEGKCRGENFSTHVCLATVMEWIEKLRVIPEIDYQAFFNPKK